MQMGDNYNPYNEVLEIVRQAADLLGYGNQISGKGAQSFCPCGDG